MGAELLILKISFLYKIHPTKGSIYGLGQKSEAVFNYVNLMPDCRLQNARYLYCSKNFKICYGLFTLNCAHLVICSKNML